MVCTLCQRDVAEPLALGETGAHCCLGCAWRVGRMVTESPSALEFAWPALQEDDADEPEPRVRLPDGSTVELRARTAELKRELPVEKRLELAEMMLQMGLVRERLLEAAFVLSSEVPAQLAQRALKLLFVPADLAPSALERLRPLLLPS